MGCAVQRSVNRDAEANEPPGFAGRSRGLVGRHQNAHIPLAPPLVFFLFFRPAALACAYYTTMCVYMCADGLQEEEAAAAACHRRAFEVSTARASTAERARAATRNLIANGVLVCIPRGQRY